MADNPFAAVAPKSDNPFASVAPKQVANPFAAVAPAAASKPKAPAQHDPGLLRRGEAALQWAASSPVARGLDAVLNATSRAGVSALSLQNPVKAVMDPAHTADTTHEAERRWHLPVADEKAGWLPRLGQAVEDFGVETLADPATYIPGLDAVSIARRLGKAVGLGKVAKRVAEVPAVDKALNDVVEGRDLRKGVTRAGEDVVKGTEAASRNVLHGQEQAYADLIERHRPELEAIQGKRAEIAQQIAEADTIHGQHLTPAEWRNLPEAAQQARKAEIDRLKGEMDATNALVPAEIRQALLQRAYREGTPGVRRQVLARGYVPTAEDRARAPLNILHNFRNEYEPTQQLFEKGDINASGGAVRWLKQGNKKATFDLPKYGSAPEDPLADRLLDRLVRGARLEAYHGSRRDILGHLGVQAEPQTDRALQRMQQATQAGDVGRAQRYASLVERQNAAANAAAGRRAEMLKPEAAQASQGLEFLDPLTARARALRDANIEEQGFGAALPTRTVRTKGGEQVERLKVQPRSAVVDTRELQGRIANGRRGVVDMSKIANIMRQNSGRTSQNAQRVVEQQQGAFARNIGRISNAAQKQSERVGKLSGALEEHNLVRQGLQSSIPGLRESAKELQGAYVAAKRLAGTIYASGFGKKVDDQIHRIAADRLDNPAGTSLTVIDREGEAPFVFGGQSTGSTPYARSEIASVLSAMRKKNPASTERDAVRVLDEAMNATGEARDQVDRIAREYGVNQAGVTPEGVASSLKDMREQFVKWTADTQRDLAKKAAIPAPIRAGIGSVGKGQQSLERTIASASKVPVPSLTRVIKPSERSAEAAASATGRAAERVQQGKEKLADTRATNDMIEAMRAEGERMAAQANRVTMPESVKRRLFDDIPRYNQSLLAAFSDLQRDALFVLPWAHEKNISILAALGPGGVKTVMRGFKIDHEMKANPEKYAAQIKELESVGATTRYSTEKERLYGKVPVVGPVLNKIADRSAKDLDRFDTAMRLALAEHLKKQGVEGFALGGQIRDVLGDYTNQAPAIEELRRRLGANFPGWGLGVVPRAMTKALREQPRAVKALARGEQVLSNDVTQPEMGTGFETGGPLSDYAEMVVAPQNFLSSQSRIGPIRSIFDLKDAMAHGRLAELAGKTFESAVPGGSIIGAATNFPYPSNAPAALSAAASPFGAYFPNVKNRQQRETQLRNLGMKGPEIYAVLRSEGYLPEQSPAASNPFSAIGSAYRK